MCFYICVVCFGMGRKMCVAYLMDCDEIITMAEWTVRSLSMQNFILLGPYLAVVPYTVKHVYKLAVEVCL